MRGKSRKETPIMYKTFASLLLLLGAGGALGCASDNTREPALVPAPGTVSSRTPAPAPAAEPAATEQPPISTVNGQLELTPSGEQPTKLSRPLTTAVPTRAAPETSQGLTGTGQVPGGVETTRETTLMIEQASARLTATRCDRERSGNNLGADRPYASLGDCQRRLSVDLRVAQNPSCNKGIDLGQIDACEREIRTQSCALPLDSLERTVSCRASAL